MHFSIYISMYTIPIPHRNLRASYLLPWETPASLCHRDHVDFRTCQALLTSPSSPPCPGSTPVPAVQQPDPPPSVSAAES
jgi:hypothetical protein